MNTPAVGKPFWLGIFNAAFLSIPLWLLFYLSLRLMF